MPKLVLDFDRTLFDTWQFTTAMKEIFKVYGSINIPITASYDKYGNFIIDNHLALVPTKAKRKKVKAHIRKLFDDAGRFVFQDAWDFLESTYQDNELVLLTQGETQYQCRKVYLALDDHTNLFKKIIIAENSKTSYFREISEANPRHEIFFIDDKSAQLEAAKKILHQIYTVHIVRRELPCRGKSDAFVPDFKVGSLTEVLAIISPRKKI
ncbi:MAG: NIF family HAD-type phosphatase [bacterium]|nr:NIF family HAD-type phosphatase [bacterium]